MGIGSQAFSSLKRSHCDDEKTANICITTWAADTAAGPWTQTWPPVAAWTTVINVVSSSSSGLGCGRDSDSLNGIQNALSLHLSHPSTTNSFLAVALKKAVLVCIFLPTQLCVQVLTARSLAEGPWSLKHRTSWTIAEISEHSNASGFIFGDDDMPSGSGSAAPAPPCWSEASRWG